MWLEKALCKVHGWHGVIIGAILTESTPKRQLLVKQSLASPIEVRWMTQHELSFALDVFHKKEGFDEGCKELDHLFEKGKIEVFRNNKIESKDRLIKTTISYNGTDTIFPFYLNREKPKFYIDFTYRKVANIEYLYTNYFPIDILDGFDGCRIEFSVFEKVE